MAQSDDSNDKFYTDPYRYGDKNLKLRQLNRDRDLSKLRGYPSDPEYMKLVGEAGGEAMQERMSVEGQRAAEKYGKKRSRTKRHTSMPNAQAGTKLAKRNTRKRVSSK